MPAHILGDDLLHDLDYGHVIECPGDLHEPLLVGACGGVVVLPDLRDHDLRVGCRECGLLVVQHLLVELLPVPKTCELDLYVLCPGKGDHPLCEVHDPDGLPHVEHEYLAPSAHSASLEHQFAGFRYEHEVSDDVRVGDGDRSPVADLLLEDGNDAAVAAEDIAESCGDELRHAPDLALLYRLVEALAVDLANPLAAPHHIGRVDGLVSGYHNELPGAVLDGEVGYDTGAVDVVLHCYRRVVLHHRDMLVGGGVEDILRPVPGENLLHVLSVGDAGDDCLVRYVRELPRHHHPDVMHRGLSLVYEYHLRGAELSHLPYDLGADGARRAGDHDPPAAELPPDGVHVHLDLLPREQVVYLHLVQLLVGECALPVPLLAVGHHHYPDVGRDELVYHLVVGSEALGLQGGHEQHSDALVLQLLRDAPSVEIDGLAHDVCPLHLLPVGYECIEGVFLVLD